MKVRYLGILLLALLAFCGCDDNTGTLGMDMLPDSDGITARTKTYPVTTGSYRAEKVYARSSTGYIGRFSDPSKEGFGSYEASFLTELNCTEDFTFPAVYQESADGKSGKGTMAGDTVAAIQLVVYYSTWFGDSLNACRMSAYELNKNWLDVRKKPAEYRYTNIDAKKYYDETTGLLGRKAYTAYDTSVPDSVRNGTDANGNSLYYPNIVFPLDKKRGNEILAANRAYQEGKNESFKDADTFIENIFKGVYLKTDYGNGTILYVDRVDLQMQFRFHYVDENTGLKLVKKATDRNGTAGSDSLYYSIATVFASTKEVIQANKFQNDSEDIKNRLEEKAHTYLKSPEGIFTEATLPYDRIYEELANDTLNAVKLTFTNYNQESNKYKFCMSAPQTVLLIREKDVDTFFEENKVPDNITSFIATHNSAGTNQYTFKNIARLVSACINEKKAAKEKEGSSSWNEEKWNEENKWGKVLLIPVSVAYDTNSQNPTIIGIQHDLKPSVAKLKGGNPDEGGNELEIEVTYTSFNSDKNL